MADDIGSIKGVLELNTVDFEKSIQKTTTTLNSFKRTLTTSLTFAALFKTFAKIKKETSAQAEAVQRLDTVMKTTGEVAGFSSKQLQVMAERLESVTTQSDQAVMSAQALIGAYNKVRGETFTRATQAALDLSAALGTSLRTSAIMVGKALQDPTTGLMNLRRVGVSLSKTQGDMIKKFMQLGQVSKAQEIILGQIETQYKNMATTLRNTLGGAFAALSVQFNKLFEFKGSTSPELIDAVNQLSTALSNPNVGKAIDAFTQKLVQAMATMIEMVGNSAEHVDKLILGIKILGGVALLKKLGDLSAVVTILAKKFKGLYDTLKSAETFAKVAQAASTIATAFGKAEAVITPFATGFIGFLTNPYVVGAVAVGGLLWILEDRFGAISKAINAVKKALNESGITEWFEKNTKIFEIGGKVDEWAKFGRAPFKKETGADIFAQNTGAVPITPVLPKPKKTILPDEIPILTREEQLKAFQARIERMRNEIKYLNKDGTMFLPILDKMLAKYKPLSEEGMLAKDFRDEIVEADLNAHKEMYEKRKDAEAKRLQDYQEFLKKQEEAMNTSYQQNLISTDTYMKYLEQRFATEKEKMKELFGTAELPFELWTEGAQKAYTDLAGLKTTSAQEEVEAIKNKFNDYSLTLNEAGLALEMLKQKYDEFPSAAQVVITAQEEINKTSSKSVETWTQAYNKMSEEINKTLQSIPQSFADITASAIATSASVGDALKQMGQQMMEVALRAMIFKSIMSFFGITGAGGSSVPFPDFMPMTNFGPTLSSFNTGVTSNAKGGVFTPQGKQKTPSFTYGGGKLGSVAETGPEIIAPARRMSNGDLGVSVAGLGADQPNMSVVNNNYITINNQGTTTNEEQAEQIGTQISQMVEYKVYEVLYQYQRKGYPVGAR